MAKLDENGAFGCDKYEDDNEYDQDDTYEGIINARIGHDTNKIDIQSVCNSISSGFYVIPTFQRRFVWTKNQVRNLAVSILKNIPIPPLYLYREKKKHVLLDGQQRATALFLYLNDLYFVKNSEQRSINFKEVAEMCSAYSEIKSNLAKELDEELKIVYERQITEIERQLNDKYCLEKTEYKLDDEGNDEKKEQSDITFSRFDEESREYILRKTLEVTIVECRDKDPQKVYAHIFYLLNSAGKLLGPQEVRNGIYYESNLYIKLFELNNEANWRNVYGSLSQYSKDVELLLKAISLDRYTEIVDDKIAIKYKGAFSWMHIMDSYSDETKEIDKESAEEITFTLKEYINSIVFDTEDKCKKAVFEAFFVAYSKLKLKNIQISYKWLCEQNTLEGFNQVSSGKGKVQERLTNAYVTMRKKYNV